jgi:uncharacterized protein YdhG (YjbR/CyaY superfamily)
MRRQTAGVAKTHDEYIARASPKFQPLLRRVRRTIRAAAPGAQEVISYQMPAFRQGRVFIFYAAFSNHCSLFIPSETVRRRFARQLKPFHTTSATHQFTPQHPFPDALLRSVVRALVAQEEARAKAKASPETPQRRPTESSKPGKAKQPHG